MNVAIFRSLIAYWQRSLSSQIGSLSFLRRWIFNCHCCSQMTATLPPLPSGILTLSRALRLSLSLRYMRWKRFSLRARWVPWRWPTSPPSCNRRCWVGGAASPCVRCPVCALSLGSLGMSTWLSKILLPPVLTNQLRNQGHLVTVLDPRFEFTAFVNNAMDRNHLVCPINSTLCSCRSPRSSNFLIICCNGSWKHWKWTVCIAAGV